VKEFVIDVLPEGKKVPGDRFQHTNMSLTANGHKRW
jgi:hypothetical protein